jgi:spore maturation protein CgeB
MPIGLDILIFGLSMSSSWGNRHAAHYRTLTQSLARSGHRVQFLERTVPWFAAHCDLPPDAGAGCFLYSSVEEAQQRFAARVREADVVMLGSFVPDGARLADWILDECSGVTAFYDMDTLMTLAQLSEGVFGYLSPRQIPEFDLYLSVAGGPMLDRLKRAYGARHPIAFCSSIDNGFCRSAAEETTVGISRRHVAHLERLVDAFRRRGEPQPIETGTPALPRHKARRLKNSTALHAFS